MKTLICLPEQMKKLLKFALPAVVLISVSCRSTGPKSVVRDRNAYINAVSESWRSQLLLNIVKLRYADAPVFLDVSSIINQYEISGQVNANAGYQQKGVGWSPSVGAAASFTDRPTITYSPLSGPKFAVNLMKPIPVSLVLGLVCNGYAVDGVLKLTLNSLNGYDNSFGGYVRRHPADTGFYKLIGILRDLQKLNSMYFVDFKSKSGMEKIVLETDENPDTATMAIIRKLNLALGLPADTRRFIIDMGTRKSDTVNIAMTTRSMIELLSDISWSIEVPQEHLDLKSTYAGPDFKMPDGSPEQPFIRIHSSKNYPSNAFQAVQYNGYWFYIDVGDFMSKQTFSHILLLTSLNEAGDPKSMPVVTVPTR